MRVPPGAPESHTRASQIRHAATTSTGLCPWTGRRSSARRAAPGSHTGMPQRRRRPVRRSAHGWVEGWPGGSANGSACGGASNRCSGPGASGTQGSACGGANDSGGGGARIGCEEEKDGRRVASNGAHGNACGGTNDGCSGQQPSGARGRAIRGARAGFDERRANRREEARDDDGARGGAWRGQRL
jgi:hypothetical protein